MTLKLSFGDKGGQSFRGAWGFSQRVKAKKDRGNSSDPLRRQKVFLQIARGLQGE